MTPASYKADAPPMMCECGLMLRGQLSISRGFCGRCWREFMDRRKGKGVNVKKLKKQYKKSKHPWGFGKV